MKRSPGSKKLRHRFDRDDLVPHFRKDGSIGAMRVHQSLDGELDRAAIAAVETWTFAPATIDGDPINVLADIEVDFQIARY